MIQVPVVLLMSWQLTTSGFICLYICNHHNSFAAIDFAQSKKLNANPNHNTNGGNVSMVVNNTHQQTAPMSAPPSIMAPQQRSLTNFPYVTSQPPLFDNNNNNNDSQSAFDIKPNDVGDWLSSFDPSRVSPVGNLVSSPEQFGEFSSSGASVCSVAPKSLHLLNSPSASDSGISADCECRFFLFFFSVMPILYLPDKHFCNGDLFVTKLFRVDDAKIERYKKNTVQLSIE